jgi:N-acetylglucosaminyldiphosphoundecaprenol N-acetyl-beta-D-mannosaminyltransferase
MPDGVGIVLAARVLHGSRIERITGSDLHLHFLRIAEDLNLRVFYLGAGMETITLIKQRLGKEYPGIVMSGYDPPYKAEFSEDDNRQMIETVNNFSPDILFVGMTAPKQEKWSGGHSGQLKVKVICNIGAVFDFYAGTVERPGKFWTSNGLEWLGRLIREPGRLWKRTFISHPVFVLEVLAARFFNFKRL